MPPGPRHRVVASDDPVNEADPTGRDSKYGVTTGVCGNVVAAIGLGIGLGIEGLPCWLSSSSGNPGVSFTLGIPGLNLGAVLSASVDFVVSDAGNVTEMGGPFYAVQASIDVIAGSSAAVFWGTSNPNDDTSMFGSFNGNFGVEFSFPPIDWGIGGDAGVWLQNTSVHELSGWACWLSGECAIAKLASKLIDSRLPSKSEADDVGFPPQRGGWWLDNKVSRPSRLMRTFSRQHQRFWLGSPRSAEAGASHRCCACGPRCTSR